MPKIETVNVVLRIPTQLKQMFAYSVSKDGETYLVGQSRSPNCQTLHNLHNNGDMIPISRFPLGDEINTEYGFMSRDAYLEVKKFQSELSA